MASSDAAKMQPNALQSELIKRLQRDNNHDAIVTEAPREQSRLTFVDTACLVINRMIGTGIYSSPRVVISGTRSAGGAILLWLLGTLCSLAGVHVYIEYGLNVPRFVIDGVEQAVPRSGGDLHYLSYVYRWPYYARGTVLYSACLYGISFICVGNMAGNCVNFGIRVLSAAHPGIEPSHAEVCAIATAAGLFSCLIHAVSRRGGIFLNDFFAVIKVCILLIVPCATFAVLAKAVRDENGVQVPNVFGQNMDPKVAFEAPEGSAGPKSASLDGYAAAYLSILFAFGGIEQSNHVLGEIKSPRRTFPRALTFSVALVGILYMVVNLCYMAVVPAGDQTQDDVALLFFRKVFGRNETDMLPDRVFNSFLALSSFGNIIVTTYTAARMKQEIAKQGFIPFARFFAMNADVSIGRLVISLRRKGWRIPFFSSPEEHREATPVGALVLHMVACLVLIWSTYGLRPTDAYGVLTNFSAYLITAFFGMFLALGILILRFYGPPPTEAAKTGKYLAAHVGTTPWDRPMSQTWQNMAGTSVYKWLSISAAILYFLGTAFPVAASWYKGTSSFGFSKAGWAVVPAVCWAILGAASLWWLGFLAAGRYREHRQQKRLVHEVWPEFDWAEPAGSADRHENGPETRADKRRRDGGKILVHETVLFTWQGDETDDGFCGVNTGSAQMAGSGRPTADEPLSTAPVAARRPIATQQARAEDSIDDATFQDFGDPKWIEGRKEHNVSVPWG